MSDWRPSKLTDIVGQEALRRRLSVLVEASRIKNDALPHMVFYGPRGTGKTTFARALAHERGVNFVETTGDSVRTKEDVIRLVDEISVEGYIFDPATDAWVQTGAPIKPTILFIDEIHRMTKDATEALYHPIEDRQVNLVKNNRLVSGILPKFTLVGATTDAGQLLTPLVTRVRMMYLEPYTEEELFRITKAHYDMDRCSQPQMARFSDDALRAVAQRSQGTPRLIVRNLSELADVALVEASDTTVSGEWVAEVMADLMGVDRHGLGALERRLLRKLVQVGKPVGIDAMAAYLGESPDNICAAERYLQEVGAILRGPRGREITDIGRGLLHGTDPQE